MQEIKEIYSMRKCFRGQRLFFQIVYEWEDILCKNMNLKISNISDWDFIKNKISKFFCVSLSKWKKRNRIGSALFFEMSTTKYDGFLNTEDVVCCIIDYFFPKEDLSIFVKNHNRAEMVLVSSREVYEYLIQKNCPLKFSHFPLSISDQWMFGEEKYEKSYDVILTGRTNSVLFNWLIQYIKVHPKIRVLVGGEDIKNQMQCLLTDQVYNQITVSEASTRNRYMHNLRISRVMLYATPGMDEGKERTNGWNQVTPRFLEGIAAQCHMICRFEDNADTRWYQLRSFSEPCNSYDEFEKQMTSYLAEDIDYDQYRCYLQGHLTSKRVDLLKEIMGT